jgi:hypothetical protein
MGVCGTYVKSFIEGNIAVVVDISMNADYPRNFFDIVKGDKDKVTLKSHSNGEEMEFTIKKKNSREFVEISMLSSFEKMFNWKAHKFKIFPM